MVKSQIGKVRILGIVNLKCGPGSLIILGEFNLYTGLFSKLLSHSITEFNHYGPVVTHDKLIHRITGIYQGIIRKSCTLIILFFKDICCDVVFGQ